MAATFIVEKFVTVYDKKRNRIDKVLLRPKGEGYDRTATWHRVKSLIPPEDPDQAVRSSQSYQAMRARWDIIGPAYDAWKKGTELPETGTPLAAWSAITPSMADALKRMGIYTVEEISEMSHETAAVLNFPDAIKLPKLALQFLENIPSAEMQEELESANERIAEMEKMIAELMSKEEEDSKPAPKKKG